MFLTLSPLLALLVIYVTHKWQFVDIGKLQYINASPPGALVTNMDSFNSNMDK